MKRCYVLMVLMATEMALFAGAVVSNNPGGAPVAGAPAAQPAPAPEKLDITKLDVVTYQKRAQSLIGLKPDITLADLGFFLQDFGIPVGPLTGLDMVGIKVPQIQPAPKGYNGLTITGRLVVAGSLVNMQLIVVKKGGGGLGTSLSLELPPSWKFSEFSKNMAPFDQLSLPNGRFIITNFEYQLPELPGIYLKEGLNFISGLNLTGPFSLIGFLFKNKAKLKGIVFEGDTFYFLGHIPENIADSSFTAIIPLRIGVDFTKIKQIPSAMSDVIQALYTAPFSFTISPKPEIKVKSGIELKLGTQKSPIRFVSIGTLFPQKVRLVGGVEGTVEFVKWFALKDVLFQVDIDEEAEAVLALLGIPITGFGYTGGLELGAPGDKRATLSFTSFLGISTDPKGGNLVDFVHESIGKNIRLSDFIYYLSKLAKKPIAEDILPIITFDEVGVTVSFSKITVGEKVYNPGMDVKGAITVAGMKGSLNFRLDPLKLVMQGSGWMSPFETPYFAITGPGKDNKYGTKDDGALVDIMVSGAKPETSYLAIKGKLDIPLIGLSEAVNLQLGPTKIESYFTSKIGNLLSTDFKFSFQAAKPNAFTLGFNVKQGFLQMLTQALKEESALLSNEAIKAGKEADEQLRLLETKLGSLQQSLGSATKQEQQQVSNRLSQAKTDLSKLKKEFKKKCAGFQAIKNAKRCAALPALISKKGVEVGALQSYKTGVGVVGSTTKVLTKQVADVTGKIAAAKVASNSFKAIAESQSKLFELINTGAMIVNIKEVGGSWGGEDAAKGISPQITFVADVTLPKIGTRTVSIRGVSFNFKDPKKSILPLAKKLIESIKEFLK